MTTDALAQARKALEPFSIIAGELFARNFNRNDKVYSVQGVASDGTPVELSLLFEAFLTARSALAAIDAALEGGGWLPIESAPKDGDEFIGRCGPSFPAFSCFFDGSSFVHYSHEEGLIAYPVAEWMPFPQADEPWLTPDEEAEIVEDINSGRWPYLAPLPSRP